MKLSVNRQALTASGEHFHGSVLVDTVAFAHEQCPLNGKSSRPHRDSRHIDCQFQTAKCICLEISTDALHMLIQSQICRT